MCKNCLKTALICLFLSAGAALAMDSPAAPVPPFTAHYAVSVMGIPLGEAVRTLAASERGGFELHSDSHTTGVLAALSEDRITETSRWSYVDGRIRPLEYMYRQTGIKEKDEEIRFDWDKHTVSGRRGAERWELPLEDGILEPQIYQIALMRDLAGGKRGDVEYLVPYKGKLKPFRLEFQGEEELDTPLGKLKALKFMRRGENTERVSTLWCAPALHYLPVKVMHKEPRGETVSMEIERVEGIGLQ